MRFDEHSFLDEITNKDEAQSCYKYLTQNLQEYQRELHEKGLSYDETVNMINTIWKNLLQSCQRVGYTNPHLQAVEKHFGSTM